MAEGSAWRFAKTFKVWPLDALARGRFAEILGGRLAKMPVISFPGGRAPPDATNDNGRGQAAKVGADQGRQRRYPTTNSAPGHISHVLMLARLMPRTYRALLANRATIAQLAQALPATAAAISDALR